MEDRPINNLIKFSWLFFFCLLFCGCSTVHDYVVKGNDDPYEYTIIYQENSSDLAISLSGFHYFINQSPKIYGANLKCEIQPRKSDVIIDPTSLRLEIFDDEISLMSENIVTVDKIFSSLSICGNDLYPYEDRLKPLPNNFNVDKKCSAEITYRYLFKMPHNYKTLKVKVFFEYQLDGKSIKIQKVVDLERHSWIFLGGFIG